MPSSIHASRAADSSAIVTEWISEDGQGSYDMTGGEPASMTAAEALTELLSQCGEETQRDSILAGRFILAEQE